ncbi:unnamed protein product [Alternaria alternata]
MAQPPPAKKVSDRVHLGFAALAANEKKMAAVRKNAEDSKYFDGSAPKTRKRREQVRAYFEAFVKSCYGETDVDQIWNSQMFTARTKQFLEGVTNITQGRFEENIKASTLWGYKHSIYWWAAVLVEDFHLLWQKWHTEVTRHIHQLSVQESLSTRSWKKNNLSDCELVLIFDYICNQRYGLDNLKQHWAALLLVWLTAVRPASFTVGQGYAKGEPLGVSGRFRELSATLRWSDSNSRCTFADLVPDNSFLPSTNERLEFDLALILLGIACQRGLFVQTLEVFVQADQAGNLHPDKEMPSSALNPKLQQLCTGVGLLERNTYYSLRRTAIVETRREHGTEKAKDLAFHVANANSLFFYDNVGFGDLDMQHFRQGGDETMSREEIRKYFSQANLARYQQTDDYDDASLGQVLNEQVRDRLHNHDEYIAKEQELKDLYTEVGKKLEGMQVNGEIPETEKIPLGFLGNDGAKYKALATTYHLTEFTQRIDDLLKARKALFRALRLRIRKEMMEELRSKHSAVLSDSQKQSRKAILSSRDGSGYQPRNASELEVTGLEASETAVLAIQSIAEAVPDEEETEGLDPDFMEQQNMHSREEPECWAGLKDVVEIQLGSGETSAQTLDARHEFLMKWYNLRDSVVPQANLNCPRCQIDPTMDKAAKDRKFNLYRLKTHMRGGLHTREKQIRRALEQDGLDHTSHVICPVCQTPIKGVKGFIKHLKEIHPEQLWEDFEDESGNEGHESEATDFEGFSDVVEGAVGGSPDDEEEPSEFGGFSSPVPTYEGKGKGRA